MLPTILGLAEDEMYVSKVNIPITTEGMLIISGARGLWSYLTVLSTSRRIGVLASKLLRKYINPKGRR